MIWFDTLGSTALLNENLPKNLETQAMIELGVGKWGKRTIVFGDKKKPPTPLSEMLPYCGLDTAYTHMLYQSHRLKLLNNPELVKMFKKLLMPGLQCFLEMELDGIYVVEENLKAQEEKAAKEKEKIEQELREYLPEEFRESANFNSNPFLINWIFGEPPNGLGLKPISFTVKGQPQVDENTLVELDHPITNKLLEWKAVVKRQQFFTQWRFWMTPEGRIHPQFNMFGPVTGRRSCQRPNLQQVSRDGDVRSCFGAPEGWVFLELDYAQIEVRIAAWVAAEETLSKIFIDGRDPYRLYASFMLKKPEEFITKEERQKAKIAVLGFLYGMGAKKFVKYAKEQYNVTFTIQEAVAFRQAYFDLFPGLFIYHDYSSKMARKRRGVTSAFGRIRHLPQVLSRDDYVAHSAERQAINFPIQSFGGDITLSSLIEIYDMIRGHKDEIMVVGDIHDALLFQIREYVWREWAEKIMQVMQSPSLLRDFGISIDVPIIVEGKVGQFWGRGTEFRLEDLKSGNKII